MVPDAPHMQYAQEQCARGADIVEFTHFPGLEHLGAMLLGAPRAIDFLGKAFDGTLHSPRRPGPFFEQPRQCGHVVNYFSDASLILNLPTLDLGSVHEDF